MYTTFHISVVTYKYSYTSIEYMYMVFTVYATVLQYVDYMYYCSTCRSRPYCRSRSLVLMDVFVYWVYVEGRRCLHAVRLNM